MLTQTSTDFKTEEKIMAGLPEAVFMLRYIMADLIAASVMLSDSLSWISFRCKAAQYSFNLVCREL